MKLQMKGLTIAVAIVVLGGMVISFFIKNMAESALMSASPKFAPAYPSIPATDITHAPQCNPGYEKQWIGCQKLDQ